MKRLFLLLLLVTGLGTSAQKISDLPTLIPTRSNVPGSFMPGYVTVSGTTSNRKFPMDYFIYVSDTAQMLANYKHWLQGYLTQTTGDARYSLLSHTQAISTITDFPTQSGNASKYLTTNGTTLSWGTISSYTFGMSLSNSSGLITLVNDASSPGNNMFYGTNASGLKGFWSAPGISNLNGATGSSQTFATGTSGTDFTISTASNVHTFNFPTASSSNRGLLSATDWSTFNNKQAALTLTTIGTSGAATLVGSTINIPQYNGTGGSSTYSGLTDVNLTSIANGQLAKYNSTSGKWENFTPTYISSYTETDPNALLKSSNLSDLVNAATARVNLGATTVGGNLFTLTNPSALGYLRINADNTVTHRSYTNVKVDLALDNVDNTSDANKPVSIATQAALDAKQATLVSGTNLKTVNGNSLLGSGNLVTTGGYAYNTYLATDYGMVGDGVTDNTTPLQTLLNTIGTTHKNSIILFPDGIYLFSGALQDGSNSNCQIKFPTLDINGKQYTIILRGTNLVTFSPTAYASTPIMDGVILRSTITGTAGGAFFGGGDVSNGISYIVPGFENLIIETIQNPVITAVNFERFTNTYFKDVHVIAGTTQSVLDAVQPTTSTSFGVIQPRHSSGINQRVEGVLNILGFYNALHVGEGAIINDVGIWSCKRGLVYRASIGASEIRRVIFGWCNTNIYYDDAGVFGGIINEHATTIGQMHVERWDPAHGGVASAWYNFVEDLNDPNSHLKGEIAYRTTYANVGNSPNTFNKTGGTNSLLCIHEIGGICTSASVTYPSDNFNSADVADIAGRITPIGGATWVMGDHGGTTKIGISSNATALSGTDWARYYVPCPTADLTVSGTIGTVDDGCFLMLRYTDISNNVYVDTKTCAIAQNLAGVNSTLYAGSGTSVAGDVIKCVLSGTSLSVYRNTTLIQTVAISSSLNSVNMGIFGYINNLWRLDAWQAQAN